VEFTDYLTGKTFTAQDLCKVRLHAANAPIPSMTGGPQDS